MRKRILIVEDSPTQAFRAQALLEGAGFEIEVAENGQVGLDKAFNAPPDLVLADIVMPVMDGYEMTRRLKAAVLTAAVPVLMVTTKNQPLDVVRGLEVGADHFIIKPYDDDDLLGRVEAVFEWLAQRRAGQLPEQTPLGRLSQEIVVTASRQQILETLFEVTARVVGCQAMALLTHRLEGERPIFILSSKPLEASTLERIVSWMVDVLAHVASDLPAVTPTQTVSLVIESDKSSALDQDGLLQSFLQAPLIVDGRVRGLVSVFSARPEAFDIHHVRFLFDMGQKAAAALSRLKAESTRRSGS